MTAVTLAFDSADPTTLRDAGPRQRWDLSFVAQAETPHGRSPTALWLQQPGRGKVAGELEDQYRSRTTLKVKNYRATSSRQSVRALRLGGGVGHERRQRA
jgi:hypothetical protein